MYCRKCGYKLSNNSFFCPKCGEKILDLKSKESSYMSIPKSQQPQEGDSEQKKSSSLGCIVAIIAVIVFFIIVYGKYFSIDKIIHGTVKHTLVWIPLFLIVGILSPLWKKHKNDVEEHMDFEKKIHEEYEHESKNNDKNQH